MTSTNDNDRTPAGYHPDSTFREQTSVPCPPWCDQQPGHPFDSVSNDDVGVVIRSHTLDISRDVWLAQDEHSLSDQGPVWETGQVFIGMAHEDLSDMSGDRVRDLARDLLAAAEKLDEVTR